MRQFTYVRHYRLFHRARSVFCVGIEGENLIICLRGFDTYALERTPLFQFVLSLSAAHHMGQKEIPCFVLVCAAQSVIESEMDGFLAACFCIAVLCPVDERIQQVFGARFGIVVIGEIHL